MSNKSLNEAIISIRVALQKLNLKKSGKNKFAGFDYFELGDFLPSLNELMLKEGVNDRITIENDSAVLTLIKGEERQDYKMPWYMFETPLNNKGVKSMQDIQYLGALNTYYKRYLYLNAFGITDGDVVDAMDNNASSSVETKITEEQKNKILTLVEEKNLPNMLNFYKVSSIDELTVQQAQNIIEKKSKKR